MTNKETMTSVEDEETEIAIEWEYAGDYCLALFKDEVVFYKGDNELVLTANTEHMPSIFRGLRQGIKTLKACYDLNQPSIDLGRFLTLTLCDEKVVISSPFGKLDVTPANSAKRRVFGLYEDLRVGFDLVGATCTMTQ